MRHSSLSGIIFLTYDFTDRKMTHIIVSNSMKLVDLQLRVMKSMGAMIRNEPMMTMEMIIGKYDTTR